MAVSHLSPEELDRLERLAFGIREVFSERATTSYRSGPGPELPRGRAGALGLGPLDDAVCCRFRCQRRRQARSGHRRGRCAARAQLRCRYLRRYRVLSAKKHEGSFRILSSSDSILNVDGKSMFIEESCVLAYTLDQTIRSTTSSSPGPQPARRHPRRARPRPRVHAEGPAAHRRWKVPAHR